MSDGSFFLSFFQNSLIVAIKISSPMLIVSIVVGFTIGIIQSATHIQDASISFVPKIIILVFTLFIFKNILECRK